MRFGITSERSPGVAERVGWVKLSCMRFTVERLPAIRSPNLCSITPPPSMLESFAMFSAYAVESLKGSVKCFDTSSAKFVFAVWSAGSS